MYDLHRLRLLRELSLRGTLAAVADALGYSPSAISHQLSLLEREVGAELLEPVGRRVRLTATAHDLVAHTEIIIRELELAEATVAASRAEVSGIVRIATFQTVAHAIVPTVLEHLHATHPLLDVTFSHVNAERAIPGLIAREFDVVLSERYPGQPPRPRAGVDTEVLLSDPLNIAVPTSWKAEALEELAQAAWVMEPEGTDARGWSTMLCRNAGFEPRVTYQSSDVYLHAALISRGLAVGVLPALVTASQHGMFLLPTGVHRAIELSLRTGSRAAPGINAVRDALLIVTALPSAKTSATFQTS